MYRLICITMTNLMQDLNGMHFKLNCTRFPIYKWAPLCSISQSADKFNITYKSKCLNRITLGIGKMEWILPSYQYQHGFSYGNTTGKLGAGTHKRSGRKIKLLYST